MYAAANNRNNMKTKTFLILILPLIIGIYSCGSSKYNSEAEAMLQSIQTDINDGKFESALSKMDSLDKRYPHATAIRSEALKSRPKAMEGYTLQLIAKEDSAIAFAQKTLDSLHSQFTHVVNSKLVENYYVVKSARKQSLMTSTAIEPRIDEDFNFYIVCSLQGSDIGLYALELKTAGEIAKTKDIPQGDERSIKSALGQKAIFSESDAEDLGRLAMHATTDGTITFIGRKGSKTIKLSAKEINAIGSSYIYSHTHKSLTLAKIRREKLERQLQIARNQIANIAEANTK